LDLMATLKDAQIPNIQLPQIVVVGEQSAGKSAVLAAISDIPFPSKATACTRFVTEIRLVRHPISRFDLKIIPDAKSKPEARAQLEQFNRGFRQDASFEEQFLAANAEMTSKPGRFITGDMLVVERADKDAPNLTLVDLPGLVRVSNKDQTDADIEEIEALTVRYLKNPRTIILAVVGGNSDYVQADILKKVREFDPTGSRTIGVVTKPDQIHAQGLHEKFLKLVRNQDLKNRMMLGWHVLRNPGPGEVWESREDTENVFFATWPWNQLSEEQTRARFLADRLGSLLHDHIAAFVPDMMEDIQRRLQAGEAELKMLGDGSDSNEELRENLAKLFEQSSTVTVLAACGTYVNSQEDVLFFTARDSKKDGGPVENLRAVVDKANKEFSSKLLINGHSLRLASDSCDFVDVSEDMRRKKKEYAAEDIVDTIDHNTGQQFEDYIPPQVPFRLFKEHSQGWQELASRHIDSVDMICERFLAKVLEKLWPRPMHRPLRRHFLDREKATCKREATEELGKLVHDLQLYVPPYDPSYKKRVSKWQGERTAAHLKDKGSSQAAAYTEADLVLEQALIMYDVSRKACLPPRGGRRQVS
jgi:GTP-binding protein EngB required for normal cell division